MNFKVIVMIALVLAMAIVVTDSRAAKRAVYKRALVKRSDPSKMMIVMFADSYDVSLQY